MKVPGSGGRVQMPKVVLIGTVLLPAPMMC